MKAEQHRATRHAFVARVEVVDLDSEKAAHRAHGEFEHVWLLYRDRRFLSSRNTNTDENHSSRNHVRGAGAGGGYANDGDGSSVRLHGTGAPADSGELAGAIEKWHELSFQKCRHARTSPICRSISSFSPSLASATFQDKLAGGANRSALRLL